MAITREKAPIPLTCFGEEESSFCALHWGFMRGQRMEARRTRERNVVSKGFLCDTDF